MIADPKRPSPQPIAPVWAGPVKFLFILSITFLFFFLVHSMVVHHFFEGTNYPNRSQVTEPAEP
jgi:hypothetical protein